MTIIDTLTAEFEKARHFKIEERRKLLKEHPELRIRIDTKLIKQIVNFIEFKCVSDSSIVRNLAIKGSDIDGGLVVSSEILPIEKRLAFVSSLRDQDFSAYDISEYETAEIELNDFTEKHH